MRSGIQHPTGAVFAEYEALTASYSRVSTEAAAWSIQAVLGLGEPPDEARREVAISAGRYLMERSFDLQTDLFVDDPTVKDRTTSFTGCVTALRALNALSRATTDSAYSECADRCARSLQVRMTRVDGSFFTHFKPDSQRAMGDEGGPEQLKATAAFLELAEDQGMAELRGVAERLLQFSLQRHEAFIGQPITDDNEHVARLRKYALFLEGLLPFATVQMDVGAALQSGIIRLESETRELHLDRRPPELLGHLIRLRLLSEVMGLGELDKAQGEAEADSLAEYQLQSTDPSHDGAFGPTPTVTELGTSLRPHPTVVSLQATEFWNEAETDGFRRGWRDLI
jgi:hypothetical protein